MVSVFGSFDVGELDVYELLNELVLRGTLIPDQEVSTLSSVSVGFALPCCMFEPILICSSSGYLELRSSILTQSLAIVSLCDVDRK